MAESDSSSARRDATRRGEALRRVAAYVSPVEAHNLIPTLAQAVEIARWAEVTVDEVAERFGFDLGGEAEVRP